jgi:hypothetical protein
MERKLTGRELRNALLSIAQEIKDDDDKTLKDWSDEINGFLLGTSDGTLAQREVVETVAKMVEYEPKMLKTIATEIGNWSVHALGRAIREYGKEYGLLLDRTAKGFEVHRFAFVGKPE